VRDKDGKIIQAAAFQKGEEDAKPGRVKPDRRWFGGSYPLQQKFKKLMKWEGNTRVISQTALDHFRTALSAQKADPYSVLLRRNKLPMGLLEDESKSGGKVGWKLAVLRVSSDACQRSHIVETEPFGNTFGPKAQRKRPRLDIGSIEELGESSTAPLPTEATSELRCTFMFYAHPMNRPRASRRERRLPPDHFYRPRTDLRQRYLSTNMGRIIQGAGLFRCGHPCSRCSRSARDTV